MFRVTREELQLKPYIRDFNASLGLSGKHGQHVSVLSVFSR